MKLARLAGNSLRDDLGILVDQNAHSRFLLPSFPRKLLVIPAKITRHSCENYQSFPREREPRVVNLPTLRRTPTRHSLRRTTTPSFPRKRESMLDDFLV
jgi:hypothetical protein